MADNPVSLLSSIRTALSASPPAVAEPGTLRIHTLFSIPRQVKSLYPLAHIHPVDLEYNKRATPIAALEEQIFITASWASLSSDEAPQAAEASKRGETGETASSQEAARDTTAPLLVLAMELYLYTIPELGSAVLYISKLDSSGWGPKAIPTALRESLSKQVYRGQDTAFGNTLTATFSSAVTQHFSTFQHWDHSPSSPRPISHLSIHILARSQRAYLFPSSPENKNKKVLSDGGLIKWWRAVMSDVIVNTSDSSSPLRQASASKTEIDARAFYVIPGYSKNESHPLVPLVREDPPPASSSSFGSKPRTQEQVLRAAGWVYGHPYSPAGASCSETNLPPLPLHWQQSSFVLASGGSKEHVQTDPLANDYDPKRVRTVPTLMPHFSDDPKTRFLDEMARDAHEHSGWKKKTSTTNNPTAPEDGESKAPGVTKEEREHGIEEAINISDFKGENGNKRKTAADEGDADGAASAEREGKRIRSDEQATSAFKSAMFNSTASAGSGVPLVTLRALMRERQAMDDLPIDEFWERMGFRQECCSGNAVGVLVILFTRSKPTPASPNLSAAVKPISLERQPLSLPYKVLGDLVFKSLMKDTCEWNKVTHARQLTQSWWHGVDREVKRKGGVSQYLGDTEKQEGVLIGQDLIWADVVLSGPSSEQMDRAKKENAASEAEKDAGARQGGGSAAPTNMLSVKRKKKPAT